jgi:hypothetical protein
LHRVKKLKGSPECEGCVWKMTCLALEVAPCTVTQYDLNELHKIYPPETVRRIIKDILSPYK